jgi:hypothetical protein
MDFGQLEQFEEIGRGGMGIVYKAWSTGANRWLAVKKLHPQLVADPRYQKLIQKEALGLSLLKHPNIVSFIAFRSISFPEIDEYGIVMDYIEGMNLKEWLITAGPPSFERLLPLFLEISSALAYLHQKNIFHLDLKPENILISHEVQNGLSAEVRNGLSAEAQNGLSAVGKPYLSDFGIASIQGDLQNTSPLTGPLGTLEYISPEQVRGEPPDGRSDLYSLGMIFYTLIHGRSFFEGMEKAAVWGKIVYETHPFSLTFPPEIPPHFQSVIRKLVEKEPSRRFPDVQTLLDHVRADKPCGQPAKCGTGCPLPHFVRTSAENQVGRSAGEKRLILGFGLAIMVVLFVIGKMFDPPRSRQTVLHFGERVQSHEVQETSAVINIDVPQIEIGFLKKEKEVEKEIDAPAEVRNVLSAPPQTLDDHELEAFLMEFKRNVEQKDLGAIEKAIRLSPSGRERFQEMFRDSREINMEFQQIKREGASIAVDYRMDRSQTTRSAQAIQRPEGTLVFQDPSWHLQ